MPTLLNTQNPYMRVYVPASGVFRQFHGGKLELAPDDPDYDVLMAEASRNPAISVLDTEDVEDKATKKRTRRTTEVKSSAQFSCDACSPAKTFSNEADLQAHIGLLHRTAPELDDDGNERGARVTTPTEVPAAQPRG